MTYQQIISDLKKKIYHPIYFLMGEEPYYIDAITQEIEENLLSQAEKGFNQTIVYGRDTDLGNLVGMARRFPMMANYQVIIVKEAQDLLKTIDIQKLQDVIKARETLETARNKKLLEEIREHKLKTLSEAIKHLNVSKPQDIKALEEVFENIQYLSSDGNRKYAGLVDLLDNPVSSTILVFAYKYGKLDRRKAFTKKLESAGVLFESTKIYENKIPDWITTYLREREYLIEEAATALLSEYLGADLSRIANELQKLIINVPPNSRIDSTHIEKYIGISKEYNIFELQKALGSGNKVKSIQIANHFAVNAKENPVVKTIAMLFGFFSKIMILHSLKDRSPNALASALSVNPYFVKDYQQAARTFPEQKLEQIMRLLQEYDMKAKGVGNISTQDGELTKELIYRIMN